MLPRSYLGRCGLAGRRTVKVIESDAICRNIHGTAAESAQDRAYSGLDPTESTSLFRDLIGKEEEDEEVVP